MEISVLLWKVLCIVYFFVSVGGMQRMSGS